MNIVTITSLRNNLADAMKKVSLKDYLLVARRGKITSALIDIDLLEDLLELADKDYLASIRKARSEYEKGDVLLHEDVFGEI